MSLPFFVLLYVLPVEKVDLHGRSLISPHTTRGSARLQNSQSVQYDFSEFTGDPIGLLAALAGLLAGSIPWFVFLYRRARRHALLPAAELRKKDPRPLILYLRSFVDDTIEMNARVANGRSWLDRSVRVTFEEVVAGHLWRYGRIEAIGKPGDRLPPLGSAREYVPDESWQQKVEQLMKDASMIVVVVGQTEGLTWELSKLLELGLTSKLVLLLPPVQTLDLRARALDLRARWDNLCDRVSEVGGIMLPRDIDLERPRAVVFPARRPVHIITADVAKRDDWTYETVLDAAAELMSNPVMGSEHVVPAPA
jgi:hypothetical protein